MFYALPADTVFEAKARTRRTTFYLFLLLLGIYVLFANLMAYTALFFVFLFQGSHGSFHGKLFLPGYDPSFGYDFGLMVANATFGAALLATAHFILVRSKTLDQMASQIGAADPDSTDSYHVQFRNIVEEVGIATGLRDIRPLVLSTTGCNAFSLQDGSGHCAIGATEGLISRLTRAELSSVIAHEAAHLVHEDTRLITTATFLFSVFGKVNDTLKNLLAASPSPRNSTGDLRVRVTASEFTLPIIFLWIISGVGYLFTRLVSTVISREREYYADADGVQMCKDPLAMAESLYKISSRYRGDIPDHYGALFILNPSDASLDEEEGFIANLFSTHPPVGKRLLKLVGWAKADLKVVQEAVEKEESQPSTPMASNPLPAPGTGFMAYQDNRWVGPYDPLQLLAMGFMTPSTWVCPAASQQQVQRASDTPELLPLFLKQVQGAVSKNLCPRCKVPFITEHYEGAEVEQCGFCKGYLLRAGILERLVGRDEIQFSREDVREAKLWRDSQKGPLKDLDHFPAILCPHCGGPMGKRVHSYLTQVVIDRCSDERCGAVWFDGGELETILMILKDAHQLAG